MKPIRWDEEKNVFLKANIDRGSVCFEDCLNAIVLGDILDDVVNHVPGREHQRLLVLKIRDYAYVVPYVETDDEIFLKTVYPSRKYTALYVEGKSR